MKRDHLKLSSASEVPAKIKFAEHRKNVEQRSQQAINGERAVKGYMTEFFDAHTVEKVDLIQEKVTTFAARIVACSVDIKKRAILPLALDSTEPEYLHN